MAFANGKSTCNLCDASGSPAPTDNLLVLNVITQITDAVGDCVYVIADADPGPVYKVARCDPLNRAKLPAIGILISKTSSTTGVVQVGGEVQNVFTGLTTGDRYWVGESGQPENILPVPTATLKAYIQIMGIAIDDEVLLIDPGELEGILVNPATPPGPEAPLLAIGSFIYVTEILPDPIGSGVIDDFLYQDPTGQTVIQEARSSVANVTIKLRASHPIVLLGIVQYEGFRTGGSTGNYEASVPVTLVTGDNILEFKAISADNFEGATDTVKVTFDPSAQVQTAVFSGGYPGSQSELKENDTYQLIVTASKNIDQVILEDFEACKAATIPVVPGPSATVTVTIANRGNTATFRPARVKVRDESSGAISGTFDTDSAGTTNGLHVLNLNNQGPEYVDNGTTDPNSGAFKGTETGTQDTEVTFFDTLTYSSPHGDFTFPPDGATSTTYVQAKQIQCTNPGDYNDSSTNFRIVANRAANDRTTQFDKVIEVADTAPIITMTQPFARLQSGGAFNSVAQIYLITATSNQNLSGSPDINPGVDGTFDGGGFTGGLKVWVNNITIDDADAKGTGAWVLVAASNRAGIAATITGNQVNGGMVERDIPWTEKNGFDSDSIGAQIVTESKVTAPTWNLSVTVPVRYPAGTTTPQTGGYAQVAPGFTNPFQLKLLDEGIRALNGNGTLKLLGFKEDI